MDWFILICAGLFEMIGITFINVYVTTQKKIAIIGIAFGFTLSFILLTIALQTISMSTGYAVWTGIGAVGGAVVGMLFFNESKDVMRILFIMVILSCAVGLKLVG